MIIPIGAAGEIQELTQIEKTGEKDSDFIENKLHGVVFVPLVKKKS